MVQKVPETETLPDEERIGGTEFPWTAPQVFRALPATSLWWFVHQAPFVMVLPVHEISWKTWLNSDFPAHSMESIPTVWSSASLLRACHRREERNPQTRDLCCSFGGSGEKTARIFGLIWPIAAQQKTVVVSSSISVQWISLSSGGPTQPLIMALELRIFYHANGCGLLGCVELVFHGTSPSQVSLIRILKRNDSIYGIYVLNCPDWAVYH